MSLAMVRKASSTLIFSLAEVSKNLIPYSSASFLPCSVVTRCRMYLWGWIVRWRSVEPTRIDQKV